MIPLVTNPDIGVGSCPRCHKPLIDPNGLGWCKACGYCRSLEESEAKSVRAPAAAAPTTFTATSSALVQTPTWFWVTLGGLVLVVVATFACGHWLSLSPFHRALLTTIQIIGGFGLMFVGQFIGLLRIAPEDATLSFKDAVFPFRLYGLIMKRLPNTRHTLYLGAWGFAAILSATIFIGGLGHWFTYLPSYQKSHPQKTKPGK